MMANINHTSPSSDEDSDDSIDMAQLLATAAHFGAGGSGRRKSSTRGSQGRREALSMAQSSQLPKEPEEGSSSPQFPATMEALNSGQLTSCRRSGTRRLSRRVSRRSSHRSATSSCSNRTVIRRNGGLYNHPPPSAVTEDTLFQEENACVNLHPSSDSGTASLTSSAHSRRANRMHFQPPHDQVAVAFPSSEVPFNVNCMVGNHGTHDENSHNQTGSMDDDNEIAQFSEMLPQEYQRLSNMQQQQQPAFISGAYRSNSTFSVDSSLFPGNMSGAVSRKRRSHTDIADAAAIVAATCGDLSDSDDCFSSNLDDDGAGTFCSKNSGGSRKTSVTRRSSGASTTGFSRLSLHNQFSVEERPRKRRSSSSSMSRCSDSIHRLSIPKRGSLPSMGLASSNQKAFNAASAAVAADNATQRLSATDAYFPVPDQGPNNDGTVPSGPNARRRKFSRRAAFVVSSIETEAAAALANRTQLLQKDRYDKIRQKRPQARRSMSYSSGIKMTSSIIASALPEDTETILENPEVKTDFMKLTRSRMERRVLSLPDQNAVTRLSQTSINDDIDFSETGHQSSALSANLEASAAAIRNSLNERTYYNRSRSLHEGQTFQQQYNERRPSFTRPVNIGQHQPLQVRKYNMPPPLFQSEMNARNMQAQHPTNPLDQNPQNPNAMNIDIPLQHPTNPLQVNHNQTLPNHDSTNISLHHTMGQMAQNSNDNMSNNSNLAMQLPPALNSSLQVAAEVFNTNAIAAQSLAQTAQVAIAMLTKAQETTSSERGIEKRASSEVVHDTIDIDSFDGKVSLLDAIEPDTPEEVKLSELIHNAVDREDLDAIRSILKDSKEATRMTASESDTGDIPLHVATRHGSQRVVDLLMEIDPECGVIRNHLGHSALHLAAEEGNLPITSSICSKCSKSARVQCEEEGLLPLHTAVSTGTQHPDAPQVTTILVQNFAKGVVITNDEGLLPIHLAAMSGFDSGIRTILSENYKTISMRESTELMLPLDFAIQSYQEEESDDLRTIELLLSSAVYGRVIPRPREAGENYPFLPLHGAAISRPSIQSWKQLLTTYHQHQLDLDHKGRTIAHLICTPIDSNENDVVKEMNMLDLIEKKNFTMYDNDGFLPLHRVVANPNVSVEMLERVVSLGNDAISCGVKPDNSLHHNMLPLQVAAYHGCSLDVIFELVKRTTASLSSLG